MVQVGLVQVEFRVLDAAQHLRPTVARKRHFTSQQFIQNHTTWPYVRFHASRWERQFFRRHVISLLVKILYFNIILIYYQLFQTILVLYHYFQLPKVTFLLFHEYHFRIYILHYYFILMKPVYSFHYLFENKANLSFTHWLFLKIKAF